MRLAPLLAAALVGGGSLGACTHHTGGATDATPSTAATATSTTTTAVTYTGDPHSRFCDMLAGLSDSRVAKDSSDDPAAVQAGMTRYRTQLHDLDAAAPSNIQPDVHLLATGIADLDDALRSVGYSWDQLGSDENAITVQAEMQDPAYTVAGDHLTAYKTQVCHL